MFVNTIATSHNNASYCGVTTLTFVPSLPSFLQITGSNLILSSTNPNDVGVTNYELTIALQDYPSIAPLTKLFSSTITCEVLTLTFTIAPPASTTLQVGINA